MRTVQEAERLVESRIDYSHTRAGLDASISLRTFWTEELPSGFIGPAALVGGAHLLQDLNPAALSISASSSCVALDSLVVPFDQVVPLRTSSYADPSRWRRRHRLSLRSIERVRHFGVCLEQRSRIHI